MLALGRMVISFQSERDPEQIDGFEKQENVMPFSAIVPPSSLVGHIRCFFSAPSGSKSNM